MIQVTNTHTRHVTYHAPSPAPAVVCDAAPSVDWSASPASSYRSQSVGKRWIHRRLTTKSSDVQDVVRGVAHGTTTSRSSRCRKLWPQRPRSDDRPSTCVWPPFCESSPPDPPVRCDTPPPQFLLGIMQISSVSSRRKNFIHFDAHFVPAGRSRVRSRDFFFPHFNTQITWRYSSTQKSPLFHHVTTSSGLLPGVWGVDLSPYLS